VLWTPADVARAGALASDWSVAGDGTSRTVWFELGSRAPAPDDVAGAQSTGW